MSRIGQAPINVPDGIEIKLDGITVMVKGKAGELSRTFPASMKIDLTDGVLSVTRSKPFKNLNVNRCDCRRRCSRGYGGGWREGCPFKDIWLSQYD